MFSTSLELLVPANGFGFRTFGLEDPTAPTMFATAFLKTNNSSSIACHLWSVSAASLTNYPATFSVISIANSNLSWNEQSSSSGIWPIKPLRRVNLSRITFIVLDIWSSTTSFSNYPKSVLQFVHRKVPLYYQEHNHIQIPLVTRLSSHWNFQPLCGSLVPLDLTLSLTDSLVFAYN